MTFGQNELVADCTRIKIYLGNEKKIHLSLPKILEHGVFCEYSDHTNDNSISLINKYICVHNTDTFELEIKTQINSNYNCSGYSFDFDKIKNKLLEENRYADSFNYTIVGKKELALHRITFSHGVFITGCTGCYFTIKIIGSNKDVLDEISNGVILE